LRSDHGLNYHIREGMTAFEQIVVVNFKSMQLKIVEIAERGPCGNQPLERTLQFGESE